MSFGRYAFAALVTMLMAPALQAPPAIAASHSTGAALIEVRAADGETLPESLAERIRAIPGVSRVEKYLLVRGGQNDTVGVEPGAALRIFTADGDLIEGKAEFGRALQATDAGKNVALVNRATYAAQAMTSMVHYLGVGQTFTLRGSRFRVVGEVSAPTRGNILLPLDTAQRLYDKKGLLTHLFVQVPEAERADEVAKTLKEAFGAAVTVRR